METKKNFDFDTVIDRRNTNSLKWDVGEKELPMWVADMDFQTAPAIREAVARRAAHGIYGYSVIPDAWYTAYTGWWENRHGLRMEKDWLIFCTGVVPAISSIVRKLTTPAEKVLLQTPVYNIFFNCVENNGRQVIENRLPFDGKEYRMDLADLEEKLADPQTTLMLLCNPQNPVGKIWDRDTLAKIGELCKKHHVTVVSDEIHCDLTDPGCAYVPFASVSDTCREISITCMAPTKAFNIAGLQTAAVAVPDPVLRHKVWRGLNTDEVAEPNAFAIDAAVAAFTEGGPWLDELRAYIYENKKLVTEYVRKHIPQLLVVPSQATYLLWLQCRRDDLRKRQVAGAVGELPLNPAKDLRERTGLFLSEGGVYGGGSQNFLRMNIACPRKVLEEGLERLKAGME